MGAVSLEVFAGDDLPISLALKDSDGTAFDLTGYTPTIVADWNEDEVVLSDTDLTIVEVDGTIEGSFSTTQTADEFPQNKPIKLKLRLIDPSGNLKTRILGRIRVNP